MIPRRAIRAAKSDEEIVATPVTITVLDQIGDVSLAQRHPSPVALERTKAVTRCRPSLASLARAKRRRVIRVARRSGEIMAAIPATTRVLDQIGDVSFVQRHRKPAKVPRANRPSPVSLANPAAASLANLAAASLANLANLAKVQGPDQPSMAAIPETTRVEETQGRTTGVNVILDHQSARNNASKNLDRAREEIEWTMKRSET